MIDHGIKRVLFVCSANVNRSPTAELLYRDSPGLWTRSAGTDPAAIIPISDKVLGWADLVVCFERAHYEAVAEIGGTLEHVHVLDIPDEYRFCAPELIDRIKEHEALWVGR